MTWPDAIVIVGCVVAIAAMVGIGVVLKR